MKTGADDGGGWTCDGGVQEQIDASIEEAVELARRRLAVGEV